NGSPLYFGGGCVYCGEVKNSKIHHGWFGCHYQSLSTPSGISCHDSEFYHIDQNVSGSIQHTHIIYDNQTPTGFSSASVYNNSLHDSNCGINIWGSYQSAVYNNVLYNLTNDDLIMLYTPPGDSGSNIGYVFNNALQCTNPNALVCLSLNHLASGASGG